MASKHPPNLTVKRIVLKRDKYCCVRCGVRQNTRAYVLANNHYKVVDEFEESWAVSTGRKVVTVHLYVVFLTHESVDYVADNLISLCSLCRYRHNRLLFLNSSKKQSTFNSRNAIMQRSAFLHLDGLNPLVVDFVNHFKEQHSINVLPSEAIAFLDHYFDALTREILK